MTKTLIIKILLVFYVLNLSAQNSEKELKAKLKSTVGDERVLILNQLSDAVLFNSPQQSLKYGTEALSLAKQTGNKKNMGESYLSVAYALRYIGEYKAALDSLYTAINFINEINDRKLESQLLNLVGLVHQDLGNDTLSMENYFKSFDMAQEVNDTYGMITTLNNLGNFYLENGNYEKSTEYFFKCLKIYELAENKKGTAQMYNNIGTVYQRQGDNEKALEYNLKAYNLIKEIPDYKIGLAYVFNNLGVIYINLGNYDKASEYLIESTKICKELLLFDYLMANYNNLGIIYNQKGEYSKATSYLLEGLRLADETNNYPTITKYLLNIADSYFKQEKYSKALSYFNRAMYYSKKLNDYYLLSENNYGIYEVYKAQSKFDKSVYHLEQYVLYRDSIDVMQKTKLTSEIEAKYELDMKEQRINTLQKDSRIKELELDKKITSNRMLMYGLSALLFIILLITYLFLERINTNKILKEQNRQINNQNEELNVINDKLLESDKELRKSNQTKDKFLSIIGHDLKNPLIAFKNFIFSVSHNQEQLSPNEFIHHSKEIEKSLNSVLDLLNNLLQWAKAQKDQIIYTEEIISVNDVINNCINSVSEQANEKNIEIINNINDHKLRTDKNMLTFIIRNIFTNAIKFSHASGKIELYSKIEQDYELHIKDFGVGIPEEYKENLLNEDSFISSQGTQNEIGTGLGLVLCKEFINKMNGKINVISEVDKGTTFILNIPLLPL